MTPSPGPPSNAVEVHRPRSSQTVSFSVDEKNNMTASDSSSLQYHVSECIETTTTTTTTTTKRTFPPVYLRDVRPLHELDSKEYPLASKPLPPELANFSFRFSAPSSSDATNDDLFVPTKRKTPLAADRQSAGLLKEDESSQESPRRTEKSPSDASQRRSRRSAPRDTSPTSHTASPLPSRPSRNPRSAALSFTEDTSQRLRRHLSRGKQTGCLATPDTSEIAATGSEQRLARPRLQISRQSHTPESGPSQTNLHDAPSPIGSDALTAFSSNVATPPITDADAEPFADADESLQQSIRAVGHRPSIDAVAAQDASLPSPRLSPTLAAAQLHSRDSDDEEEDSTQSSALTRRNPSFRNQSWLHESQITDDGGYASDLSMVADDSTSQLDNLDAHTAMLDARTMMERFDAMPVEMKSFIMYNFLRRCPRKTLRLVSDVVTPALKCDFLKQLPLELSFHVLSFLDHRDLCRAAQVSKHWRNIVDTNETGWKELFDRDGFTLPPGELMKAICHGWGWQDPVGVMGAEVDLSRTSRLNSADSELTKAVVKPDPTIKLRSSKRKRGINIPGSDRSKRRVSGQDAARNEAMQAEVKQHKSEGPLSAANAAAAAVPNPQLGMPSLQKLHLFKSLYRRHYMIRQSWTSGKVKPGHVAFAAHPRHVITCLQFDEDKIITGSDDTLIHVYDTKTGKLRKKLEGHEGGVWALQYEGNMLVSGSTDRSVRVWDIEKGFCTQVFYGHTSTVRCLQILMPTETGKTHDGKAIVAPQKPLIITGSRDSQLRVWRLPEVGSRRYIQTGPPANDTDCPYFIRTLSGHTHSVRAISAHGDTLVSGSYDSTVRVWRISTGESLHVLHGHSQKVYSVVLDHERNRCISGSMDSLVKIWDLNTGACLHTLEGHSLLVGLLDLRDERLVSAAADSTLRIWDPENGKCKNVLTAHTGAITCFQHDGRKVISGSEKTVKMWDIRTGECVQDLLTDLSGVWQVKFDERRCVAAVQRDSLTYVEILDFGAVRDGKPPEELGQRKLLNEPEVRALLAEDA
ncbi:WD repeat containing protein pop1 [Colletotrichum karsti]|uniref:WD repeat containing protein pop1 n=1 Tax=Colletotrichum karsti TaxID=1095194 RepID=A0A9P6IDS8_9PEZI|nr:WD repeat containing protein pop1 [Colletotrichum karsti]KAF9880522.1 WD repeat containing protein pop1 [Colletotrichum karsti]